MKRARQRRMQLSSLHAEHNGSVGQLGLDLIQLCMEVGWLKSDEELQALSGVCRVLNRRTRKQIKELKLPVSSLLDLQQRFAWRKLTNLSSSTIRTSAPQQQPPRPVTRGLSRQVGATSVAGAANGSKCRAVAAVAEGLAADGIEGSSATMPSSLQEHISTRLPEVGRVSLHYNSVVQSHILARQLQQLALLPQLTSLEIKDSCSWSLPCAGFSSISALTGLKQLELLVQSPGMPSSAVNMLGFPPVATAWQGHVMQGLSTVAALTALQHLQMRFICGERGYFMSSGLLAIATVLTRLSYLDLGYVEVTPDGLSQLARLTCLDCFIMYGCLSALSAADFSCLSSLRSLQRLEMFHDWPPGQDDVVLEGGGWDLTDQQAQQLGASLACLTRLSWLNLPMSGRCTSMLPLLQKLPSLKQLYLQSIERHQIELPLVSFAATASSLQVLQVDNVRLTAAALASIAGLTLLQQLTLFNLLLDPSLESHQCLTQLSQLNRLEQLCFDSLTSEPGGGATAPVLDNTVLSTLAPHWSNLQSLHISYAALPEAADLQLNCFTAFSKLSDLSLYCFQQAGMQQQEVVLDAAFFPDGLQSLCLSTLALHNAHLLPTALQHLWLTDLQTPDMSNPGQSIAAVISGYLHGLRTLVLRCCNPGGSPSVTTHDLTMIVAGCPRLECLGMSLPETNPGQIDLRVLAPLTRLRQLLLDYRASDPTVEGHQQQQEEEQEEVHDPAAAAAVVALPDPQPLPLQEPQLPPPLAVQGNLMIPAQQWQLFHQQLQHLQQVLQAAAVAVPAAAAAAEDPHPNEVPQPDEDGEHDMPDQADPAAAAYEPAVVPPQPAAAAADNVQAVQGALQHPAVHAEHAGIAAALPLAAAMAAMAEAAAPAGEAGGFDGIAAAAAAAAANAAGDGGGAGMPGAAAVVPPAEQQQQDFNPPGQAEGDVNMQPGFPGPLHELQAPDFDAHEVVQQLSELGQHITKLRGLWLSDNVLLGAGLGLQQLLQQSMPFVTIRPTANDWFWGTNFPMGSCLYAENPMEWWKFTSWTIL